MPAPWKKNLTSLDSALKSRGIALLTKVPIVNAVVFPVVMYGCESWTIKKTEPWRIDAFELWCWRRLLRVPWTARSNLSILEEINWIFIGRTDAEAEAPTLWPADSLENTLMLRAGGEEGSRGWESWLAPPIQCAWVWANSRRWWSTRKPGVPRSTGLRWKAGYDREAEPQRWGRPRAPRVRRGKEHACRCGSWRRGGLDPWVRTVPGEINGNPLRYSGLEKPMDRGAWWAAARGITEDETRLKQLNMCVLCYSYRMSFYTCFKNCNTTVQRLL